MKGQESEKQGKEEGQREWRGQSLGAGRPKAQEVTERWPEWWELRPGKVPGSHGER